MTDRAWKLWTPPSKPEKIDGRLRQTLTVAQQEAALRETIDAAMVLQRDVRSNYAAARKLRRFLAEYPHALDRSHIAHNLGPRRITWVREYFRDTQPVESDS